MRITVVNLTDIADEEVLPVVRAVNRQVAEDFAPYWDLTATLRLEGEASSRPRRQNPTELRGDAIMYLWDEADVDGAIGYHEENNRGLPCGFVFTEIAEQIGEPYSVTLSHEVLELVADANINKLAAGPHPEDPEKWVLHWYEMCDAVQAESYKIDGVAVSNFVLPLYFTWDDQVGSRNDFLGRVYHGSALRSFDVNPGGYIGFLDPETGEMETYFGKDDAEAQRRMEIKSALGATRRSVRKANLRELTVKPSLLRTAPSTLTLP